MGKIIAAAAAAAAFVSFSAHASNVIVFGQNRDNCGHGVLCSVDGTHGYLDNGRGRPFNASAIARWFQVDIDGKTHLKGQQGEPLRGSGAFLVLNDTGRPISLFALALADDFRGAPGDVCRGAQSGKPCNGFSAQSGTGSYRYKSQLSGADWDRCTQGKAKRRLCIGNPSTAAEFAAGRITYSWRAGSGGAIPKGAVFTIAFADWNSNAWSAPTAPPSIIMVSSNNGVPGDNESYACCASITPDGAHAVFHSGASNIPGATPGVMSVYVYGTGDASYTAIPTSLSPDDSENVVLSDDATAVALAGTDSNTDIGNYYVFDLAAQTTQVIPNCYDMTNRVLISGDGRYVVYESGQVGPCQGSFGVFVYDRSNGTATQMLAPDGTLPDGSGCQPIGMNDTGQFVVISCDSDNLVEGIDYPTGYVWDRASNTFEVLVRTTNGTQGIETGVSTAGLSTDGRYVVFNSSETDLVPGGTTGIQTFRYDRATQVTTLVSSTAEGVEANSIDTGFGNYTESISPDGRYVAFWTNATNLVPGVQNTIYAAEAYVKDLQTGEIVEVSLAPDGTPANANAEQPMMSSDTHYILFDSQATNLVAGGNPGKYHQVYLATMP